MTDKEELRRLAVVATGLRNCNKAWRNPVSTVDCDLYYRDNSLALAEFYAAANPATVLELLDEIERLRAEIAAMRKQEPFAWTHKNANTEKEYLCWTREKGGRDWRPLYLAPGAQPARKQEPVAWRIFDGEGGYDYCSFADNETLRDEYIRRNGEKYADFVEPLYSVPGAQPAPSVPDGWKLVPVEPTYEMLRAGDAHDWYSDKDPTWADLYRAMVSAAPDVQESNDA